MGYHECSCETGLTKNHWYVHHGSSTKNTWSIHHPSLIWAITSIYVKNWFNKEHMKYCWYEPWVMSKQKLGTHLVMGLASVHMKTGLTENAWSTIGMGHGWCSKCEPCMGCLILNDMLMFHKAGLSWISFEAWLSSLWYLSWVWAMQQVCTCFGSRSIAFHMAHG
jgi:hypothetical protein